MIELNCRRCGRALGLALDDGSPYGEVECSPDCGRPAQGMLNIIPEPRWPGSLVTPAYE